MFLKNGRIRSALGGRVMEKPLATHAVNRSKILAPLGEDTANARYTAATRPIADCHANLVLADSPFGLRSTTLRWSPPQPIAPKPSVTTSTAQRKRLGRSPHSSVV